MARAFTLVELISSIAILALITVTLVVTISIAEAKGWQVLGDY